MISVNSNRKTTITRETTTVADEIPEKHWYERKPIEEQKTRCLALVHPSSRFSALIIVVAKFDLLVAAATGLMTIVAISCETTLDTTTAESSLLRFWTVEWFVTLLATVETTTATSWGESKIESYESVWMITYLIFLRWLSGIRMICDLLGCLKREAPWIENGAWENLTFETSTYRWKANRKSVESCDQRLSHLIVLHFDCFLRHCLASSHWIDVSIRVHHHPWTVLQLIRAVPQSFSFACGDYPSNGFGSFHPIHWAHRTRHSERTMRRTANRRHELCTL